MTVQHEHHEAVEAQGDAAVGRGTEAQSVQQKGEFALAKEVVPFLIQLVRQVRQIDPDNLLTRREEEVMACLFEGLQDKEIASRLGIGAATVHTHMHRLFEKLGVHSRRELIAKFLTLDAPGARGDL